MNKTALFSAVLLLAACADDPPPDPLAAFPEVPRSIGSDVLGMGCSRLEFTRDSVRAIQRYGEGGARLRMLIPTRSSSEAELFDGLTALNPSERAATADMARAIRRQKGC
ncbi:MAG: hypothetical protein AAFQ36_12580 [Pseudomonadota bacterium]